jgi:hypothetical protein
MGLDGLVGVLLDRSAREDERDDAAMDLAAFDVPRALEALMIVESNRREDLNLLDSCGAAATTRCTVSIRPRKPGMRPFCANVRGRLAGGFESNAPVPLVRR